MLKIKYCFLFFSLAFLTSCVPTLKYASFDNTYRSPNSNPIDVFTTTKSIPYMFKEIGMISIEGTSNDQKVINIAKVKAAQLGGDGILLISSLSVNDGYFTNGNLSTPFTKNSTKFSVIIKLK